MGAAIGTVTIGVFSVLLVLDQPLAAVLMYAAGTAIMIRGDVR